MSHTDYQVLAKSLAERSLSKDRGIIDDSVSYLRKIIDKRLNRPNVYELEKKCLHLHLNRSFFSSKPSIVIRCCKNQNDRELIRKRLQDIYGDSFDIGIFYSHSYSSTIWKIPSSVTVYVGWIEKCLAVLEAAKLESLSEGE